MSLRETVENPQTLKWVIVAIVALSMLSALKKLGRVMAAVVIILGIMVALFVMNPQWAGSFWTTFDASNPWGERSPNKAGPKPGAKPAPPPAKPAQPPKR